MRKFLLASVATLGAGGLTGAAFAQAPAAPVGAPTQGQVAFPAANPVSYVNNNNNYQAPALPGALANPTPGTIVVHFNGKVVTEFQGTWTSADNRLIAIPGTALAGGIKLQPLALNSFARLYAGGDGMATNGLRYGAAIELRENFSGQITSTGSSGASGYSSLETMFVRRAFTYVAGEQWGIVRLGQADGLISIFDNGVTTFQFLPTGNLNGGDLQNMPTSVTPPFWFVAQAGNEYTNTKAVYLSPQIAGFDFGIQYAPNTSNGFGLSGTAGGLAPTSCSAANTGCPTLSSSPIPGDGARVVNQYAAGIRYQGKFGDLGVLAYGVYEGSGHVNYTGPSGGPTSTAAAVLGTTGLAGSRYTGHFDGLSVGSMGVAVTFGGFTVGGNGIIGRANGQLALAPQGGVGVKAYLIGAKYTAGPLTVGIVAERGDDQGNIQMSGITQRRGRGISAGAAYTVAPGYQVFGEYLWNDIYQGGVNQITGARGTPVNNEVRGQGFLIGQVVNF
jgi:hypothetical protein